MLYNDFDIFQKENQTKIEEDSPTNKNKISR